MIIYDHLRLIPHPAPCHLGSRRGCLLLCAPLLSRPPTPGTSRGVVLAFGWHARTHLIRAGSPAMGRYRVQPTRTPQARLVRPSGRFDALTGGHVPHGHFKSHEDTPALLQWRLGASPSRGGHLRSRTVRWRNGIPVFGRVLPPLQGDMFLMAMGSHEDFFSVNGASARPPVGGVTGVRARFAGSMASPSSDGSSPHPRTPGVLGGPIGPAVGAGRSAQQA